MARKKAASVEKKRPPARRTRLDGSPAKQRKAKQSSKGEIAKVPELPPRREKFVDNYLANGGNGTKAAESAGYAPGAGAEVEASRLLRNAKVRAHIEARLNDARIKNNEILGTLASHMRGDLADIFPNNPILKAAKESGHSHLIRKLKQRERFIPQEKGKPPIREVDTEVELHDAHSAAKYLAKVRGLEQAPRENDADRNRRRQGYADAIERIYDRALEAGEIVTREDVARQLIARKPEAAQYIDLTEYAVA
jgi:hypothetical protein